MIIGHGNIARAIDDRPDVIFFASGVSDSGCTDQGQFNREVDLIYAMAQHRHLVYFSTLSIYISDSPYNEHKRNMESIVKERFQSYTIVRVGVIEWGKNPTTIHNVFKRKLAAGEPIELQDTYRWITPLKDFKYWLRLIRIGEREEMNISGLLVTPAEILQMIKENKL